MKYKWLYAPRQASKNLLAAWLLFITFGSPALAAWSVHEPSVIGASTVAYAENSTGQRIEVFVEENGTVVLRLQLGSGFETFSRANCPNGTIWSSVMPRIDTALILIGSKPTALAM